MRGGKLSSGSGSDPPSLSLAPEKKRSRPHLGSSSTKARAPLAAKQTPCLRWGGGEKKILRVEK